MTLHFLNGRSEQDLSTESVNKQILGTDYISTLIQALINVFKFSENLEWFRDHRDRFPRSRKIKGSQKSRKISYSENYEIPRNIGQRNTTDRPGHRCQHRPQCNIGPGISPVTINTMDDRRKRPGSPGLASSTQRRRANDEMNAHRMLGAITASVVVVAAVTSSVTRTMLASDTRRRVTGRSRRLDWEEHCEDHNERGTDYFRRQYRMPQQTFGKLADILRVVCVLHTVFFK